MLPFSISIFDKTEIDMKQFFKLITILFVCCSVQSCYIGHKDKLEEETMKQNYLEEIERNSPEKFREIKHMLDVEEGYDDEVVRFQSEHWWDNIRERIGLTGYYSKIPCAIVLLMGIIGIFILFTKNNSFAIGIYVLIMGACELYHFMAYTGNPIWFYSPLVAWYWKLILMFVITAVLYVQCLLTDRATLPDNSNKEDDYFFVVGMFVYIIVFSTYLTFYTGILLSWNFGTTILNYVSYIAVIILLGYFVVSRPWQAIKSFVPLLFSLCGICITMAFCPWTGFLVLILTMVTAIEKGGRADLAKLMREAAGGNSEAMVKLGRKIKNGEVRDKSIEDAVSLFREAMSKGNAKAYNALARCYLGGTGVPLDGPKALELAMKSYEMGYIHACETIGTYYRMGKFIPIDHVNGHKWDMIGTEKNVLCQIRVAIDYAEGQGGVVKNENKAAYWYKKVADNRKVNRKDRGYASWRYALLIGGLGNIPEGKKYIRQAQDLGYKRAIEVGDDFLKCDH